MSFVAARDGCGRRRRATAAVVGDPAAVVDEPTLVVEVAPEVEIFDLRVAPGAGVDDQPDDGRDDDADDEALPHPPTALLRLLQLGHTRRPTGALALSLFGRHGAPS